MTTRREFLGIGASGLLLAGAGTLLRAGAEPALEVLPGKLPLIRKSYRPPNYETPLAHFREVLTPNAAFFVRYHLANIPDVSAADWRLRIGGDAAQSPYELTLDELRSSFEPVELVAVCQCSGNRRGLFQPHVPGVQWGIGAMGNARWRGTRLKDVLAKAGIRKEAVEVVFDGADGPVLDTTPDFVKSVPLWKALDENTLIAYEMNGEPLPHWNGYPARIVVAGWTATYWMKHVVSINVASQPLAGFWMNPAYRVPKGRFPMVDRFASQETEVNTPVTEIVVNSLITRPEPGQRVRRSSVVEVAGIAWDGGYGISGVEISVDGGSNWRQAGLGEDKGRYSFRPFSLKFTPQTRGTMQIMARASNRMGATQVSELIPNPAGYYNNVAQTVAVEVE